MSPFLRPLGARILGPIGLRLPPLDWTRSAPAVAADPPPNGVDIVIPIYGAPDEFRRCLASVIDHTDLDRNQIIAVLDGPGQDSSREALARVSERHVTVLENPRRLGFVRTANRGLVHSIRDVVLLNSDTEVTAKWMEKLEAAAYADPAIATATPFSSNATLGSLPQPFENNAIPTGHDLASFSALVERVAEGPSPRVPTGVGVCLYIKRKVLDAIGLLDEATFGLGYGEEVDFCLRAIKAGFIHVLDHRTYIFHAGQRSFGSVRAPRVRSAERLLARRHPEYVPTIAAFMRADTVAAARSAVHRALLPPSATIPAGSWRVLHVVHGWPPYAVGGTETYARQLVLFQATRRDVAVFARISDPARLFGEVTELSDGGARVRLVVNDFEARNPLVRNALASPRLERDFEKLLDEFAPDLVHVHHLAGHSLSLLRGLEKRRIPSVLQLQDWWLLCGRANLIDVTGALCPGPSPARCTRCLPFTRLRPMGLLNAALFQLRRLLARRMLQQASAVVAGSRFVVDSLRGYGMPVPQDAKVLPYGAPRVGTLAPRLPATLPLRFVCLGAVMPHKGTHVAARAFDGIDPSLATLDLWGSLVADSGYAEQLRRDAPAAVRLRGPLPEEDKLAVLREADALILPSLGYESFGIVIREAMAVETPVLASRGSALVEAFEDGACGAFFEPGDVDGLRRWVNRLVEEPSILDGWRHRMPRLKSIEEHAVEIEAIYASVLAGRSS